MKNRGGRGMLRTLQRRARQLARLRLEALDVIVGSRNRKRQRRA